eukprot:TRINITY_DN25368_c1_g1_i1.p1 TRINITY_DN25368_c1_g1~~TRINITY_DN25368_c1_g1_i1.p1  ORF type:complete len:826 (-),score=136.41 TRINITY_DN25368_c1_g1_i1:135-2261(-)
MPPEQLVPPSEFEAPIQQATVANEGEAVPAEELADIQWTCATCNLSLSWGNDWRHEGKLVFCKPCYQDFDNRWWDFQTRDRVRLDVGQEPAELEESLPQEMAELAKPKTLAGSRLLQLLPPLLGGLEPKRESPLSGVDSLAVLTLCRQLRLAVPGLTLRPQDVFRCGTVGELLAVVEVAKVCSTEPESQQTRRNTAAPGDTGASRAIWFAPGQYNSTCKWLYGCRGLLSERIFRRAAAKLIARHEALRAETPEGAAGVEMLRFLRDVVPLHVAWWSHLRKEFPARSWLQRAVRRAAVALSRASAWSLKGSWPRSQPYRLTEEMLQERVRVVRCRTWRDVEQASQQLRDDWQPPFLLGLFMLEGGHPGSRPRGGVGAQNQRPEEWGAPSSFVQFVVTHAYSDGYSVPLIQDLAALYADAALQNGEAAALLAPLPEGSAFEALESRFFATCDGQPEWSHPDQLSLRATTFDVIPRSQPWVYTHEVLLEGGTVGALHAAARKYGLPFEVVFLSLWMASCCKASWGIQAEADRWDPKATEASALRVKSMALTLYAPMRDGDLNEAMVGLFSDWRDFTIQCTGSTSLLGLCLEVADIIRHRRWTIFDPFRNTENILVNILALDAHARGPQQFQQTRAHEYGGRRNSNPDQRRACKAAGHRPMRVTLEQEAPDAWWLTMDLNASVYPTQWCRRFCREFQSSCEAFLARPCEALQ